MPELQYSCVVGDVCCERCHCAAAPASIAALRYRAPKPPSPSSKRSAYARLIDRVWARLKQEGNVFTLADGTGRLLGFCPVCSCGTIALQLLGTHDEPRLRLHACSDGCSEDLIAERLR